jgi:phosphate:Na+ symporter
VLNDLERIGDHAENFYGIGAEMKEKGLSFSDVARKEIKDMHDAVTSMTALAKDAFDNVHEEKLPPLAELENRVDEMKRELTASHFARLAEGKCSMEVSPYYSSVVVGLERVADHLINVGYSIISPTGSQKDHM